MEGHRVKYYVFTDQPARVPTLKPCKGRQMIILKTQASNHQLDMYVYQIEMTSHFSQQHFAKEVDYLVCAHVNIIFCNCGCGDHVLLVWHAASSLHWIPKRIFSL